MLGEFTLIMLAAGNGERLQVGKSKALVELAGQTILERSLSKFQNISRINQKIIVASRADFDVVKKIIGDKDLLVEGGERRQDSVRNALREVQTKYVVIHEAARPFATREVINSVLEATAKYGAATAAVPVIDTIKLRQGDKISKSLVRDKLCALQTPQACYTDWLREGFDKFSEEDITDDTELIMRLGKAVHLVDSSPDNFKITYPRDLIIAEALI